MTADGTWLDGLEDRARAVLPASLFEYIAQGARDSVTVSESVDAWRSVRFRAHVLRDVTVVDPSVTLLGHRSTLPWGIAPTTLQRAVHPDGELAMARATASAGGVMVVSSNSGTAFSDIGDTGVHWWLQAYLPSDRTLAEPMLERAVAAGAQAVVLTVDTPVVGTKHTTGADIWGSLGAGSLRTNFDPAYDDQPGSEKALDLGPHDLDWLSSRTGLPVVVKGVVRPDDARRCVQAGAKAVWVSNHGGRQLDRSASTASSLAGVLVAVEGAAEVYVDGGLRSGLDIVAAMALGADAVFLGRLPLFALVEGEAGVTRMHAELLEQTVETLRVAGCPTVGDTRGIATSGSEKSL